jgi:hypothetical protein
MRAERADAEADAANMRGGYARAGYDVNRWFSRNWSGEYFPDARLSLIYEFNYVSIEDLTSPTLLVGRERKHVLGWRYEPDHSWILKVNREWSDASGRPLINGDADGWAMGVGFVF